MLITKTTVESCCIIGNELGSGALLSTLDTNGCQITCTNCFISEEDPNKITTAWDDISIISRIEESFLYALPFIETNLCNAKYNTYDLVENYKGTDGEDISELVQKTIETPTDLKANYFDENVPLTETYNIDYRIASLFYITDSYFTEITSETDQNGGALSIQKPNSIVFIEKTTFHKCQTQSDKGGAIFMNCLGNPRFGCSFVCGIQCQSLYPIYSGSSTGQFDYIILNDISNIEDNYISETSISLTSLNNQNTEALMHHQFGNYNVTLVNISKNDCYSNSGFAFGSTHFTFVSYLTIENNTAEISIGTLQKYQTIPNIIQKSNFIGNKQNNENGGILYFEDQATILSCCFEENDPGNGFIIYNKDTIITIEDDNYISYEDSNKIINQNLENSYSYDLNPMFNEFSNNKTHECYIISYIPNETIKPNDPIKPDDPNDPNSDSLSAGEIAAISVSVIVDIGAIIAVAIICYIKKRREQNNQEA